MSFFFFKSSERKLKNPAHKKIRGCANSTKTQKAPKQSKRRKFTKKSWWYNHFTKWKYHSQKRIVFFFWFSVIMIVQNISKNYSKSFIFGGNVDSRSYFITYCWIFNVAMFVFFAQSWETFRNRQILKSLFFNHDWQIFLEVSWNSIFCWVTKFVLITNFSVKLTIKDDFETQSLAKNFVYGFLICLTELHALGVCHSSLCVLDVKWKF